MLLENMRQYNQKDFSVIKLTRMSSLDILCIIRCPLEPANVYSDLTHFVYGLRLSVP